VRDDIDDDPKFLRQKRQFLRDDLEALAFFGGAARAVRWSRKIAISHGYIRAIFSNVDITRLCPKSA
jgi:hypothetical protein